MINKQQFNRKLNEAIEAEFKDITDKQTFFFKDDLEDLERYLKAYTTFLFNQSHTRFPGGIKCMISGHTPVLKHTGAPHYCELCLKKL